MPPRRRQRRDPELAKQRLLDAAQEAFAERGYRGARTSDIAKAAGYSEATVYHHFGTKKNLFREVVTRLDAESSWMSPTDDPDEFVRRMLAGELAYHRDARWRRLDHVWGEALAGEKDLLELLRPQLEGTLATLAEHLARFDGRAPASRPAQGEALQDDTLRTLATFVMVVSYGSRVLRRYDPEALSSEDAARVFGFATRIAQDVLHGRSDALEQVDRLLHETDGPAHEDGEPTPEADEPPHPR